MFRLLCPSIVAHRRVAPTLAAASSFAAMSIPRRAFSSTSLQAAPTSGPAAACPSAADAANVAAVPPTTPASAPAVGRTIAVGDCASASCVLTAEAIAAFSQIVGDNNPIHLDAAAARAAGFDRIVAHGTLSIGVISNVLGTRLPGPQTVYLQQKTEFVAPVFAGDTVTATVTVKEFSARKGLMWLDTIVTKRSAEEGDGASPVVVIRGYALAMNKTVSFVGESDWTFKR